MADILAHQIIARGDDQMPFAYIPQVVQNGGHTHWPPCLPVPGAR
ncbi:MAG: hypothetical protein U0074_15980 [Kouleothrix sp.]